VVCGDEVAKAEAEELRAARAFLWGYSGGRASLSVSAPYTLDTGKTGAN